MRTHHAITTVAAAATILLALTGCSSDSSDAAPDKATPTASAPAADPGKAREAAGIPPSPAPAQRAAYIAALTAIDPEIVNGKEDKAVSRGLSQCQTMKDEKDPAKRVSSAERRFIGPNHPDGFGTAKSTLIVGAVLASLCPTY